MNYEDTLKELGLTQHDMDQAKMILPVPMLSGEESAVYFAHSQIEGNGAFAIRNIPNGQRIAPLRKDGRWTLTGMMTNHSGEPNTRLQDDALFASKDISKHDELFVDYLQIKEELAYE